MCEDCHGLGTVIDIDAAKVVPDENLSISEGAVKPWDNYFERDGSKKDLSWGLARIEAMEEGWGLNLDIPWKKILKKIRDRVLYGSDDPRHQLNMQWAGENGEANGIRLTKA